MKNIVTTIIATLFITTSLFATDRIVAEGGQGGTFASINDAITAAVSGDRILIYPKANGAQYSEDITVTNKSLQLLSATEGTLWKLNGSIVFNPASTGMELVIHQAHLINGNMSTGINAPTGTRCKITVLGCLLTDGFINFATNYFDCVIENNTLLNGYIQMKFGRIVGNSITCATGNHNIIIQHDAVATNDLNYVVGNYINMTNTTFGYAIGGIYQNNSNQYYYIANNFIDTDALNNNPVYVVTSKTGSGKNYIQNNSVYHNGSNNSWAVYVSSTNSITEVFNNFVHTGGFAVYAFYGLNSVNSIFGYNYTNLSGANAFNTMVNDGTNVSGATFTIDTATGEVLTGSPIDGGSPDNAYLDLDLTRNDADCFGGSYSRANFINTPTGAITTFMIAPRRVLSGQTINISADGYDR